MVETETVASKEEFVSLLADDENDPLSADAHRESCYDVWRKHVDDVGDRLLVLIPEWFSGKELDARRPVLFATVEHDDPDSGAVLFSDTEMLHISVVENQALGELGLPVATEELDISEDDDYIDDPGLIWIPRSQMTVFEHV